ncbi:MAG: ExeM/NucH family extracellular endonuclease [Methylibium sp.]|uniref:ExeM/NucH family extracellular endonuclease n=1 Tax=Methylibium sp. TaxID=2067992 RepID=UPI0017BC7A75|nr:ExeM/NucH family extracellular endonuclease [Methylibium sp.]MBA3596437.1 ExeM/NucH family extracellular endonuclease [Methylibium sp.]
MNKSFLLGGLLAFLGCAASAQGVVISQVYGGGGNSGATLRNDFVELFNASTQPVNLAGWSVQYASATGSSWQVTALESATLQPGQYYLVQQAMGAGGSAALPAPDASGTTAMSASAGKVALLSTTAALSGTAPASPALVDLIGFGSAGFFEGSAAAPTLSNTTGALRAGSGCTDSNDNRADFATGAPSPRNRSAAFNVCDGAPVNAPIVTTCPALNLAAGSPGRVALGASDADGLVGSVAFAGSVPAGISLGELTPATGVGGSAGADLRVASNTAVGSYAVELRWGNDQAQTANCTVLVNVASLTRIPTIQGRGANSPLAGMQVATEGVVTKVTNNGFFLQDAEGDGDASTSDGLFVFNGSSAKPTPGQRVQLSGTVTDFNTGAAGNPVTAANPLTQLSGVAGFTVVGNGPAIAPVTVSLPEMGGAALERYESMLVTIAGPVTVSQNFFLGRYGQMTVAVGPRLENPTNRLRPGPEALALAEQNARRSLLLDDATSMQNPNPIPYIGTDNTVRAGDTAPSLTGVLDYGLATASNTGIASYRLQPTTAPVFTRSNPRTAAPENVGGNIKVASFNVLNFFTTFTDGTTADGQSGQGCTLGTSTAASNCRGANNAEEFARQRAKIVEAMVAIDADVLGLIEIQNNGTVATQNLVDALNARLGSAVYAVVPDPEDGTGTDAIRQAIIFKSARLSLVGTALSDTDPVHDRPPLAQTLAAANGERFTLVVNHFKSKGCGGASGADIDQGDLQGCYNATRVAQAQALSRFVTALQAAADSEDVLVIGDLNAYAKEDPIAVLAETGLVDEVARDNGFGYSFVFDGAAGRLDHALATDSLREKVERAILWPVNADEPSVIDYNTEFKPQDLYAPNAYRSSDHDPVIVGLNLVNTINGTRKRDRIVGTLGDDVITGGAGPDLLTGGAGNDLFVYNEIGRGLDLITDFEPGADRIDLRGVLAALGTSGADAVASGQVRLFGTGVGTLIVVDTEEGEHRAKGRGKRSASQPLVLLRGVKKQALVASRDFVF